ncbi:hypothetical protein BXY66_1604 [Shimia isoporae]|uniref:Uncharacterized protein n=1 Tax=Shimia isoporae TaxID=647720 RepID=A0A4R1NS13_9RHOB|nr:hypothetical protein BXY66_1604 [Shimia isoporae]
MQRVGILRTTGKGRERTSSKRAVCFAIVAICTYRKLVQIEATAALPQSVKPTFSPF